MPRRPPHAGNGRRTARSDRSRPNPVSISWEDAAALVEMKPRTLRNHLKRMEAECLIRIPRSNRYRLDRKGFLRQMKLWGYNVPASLLGG